MRKRIAQPIYMCFCASVPTQFLHNSFALYLIHVITNLLLKHIMTIIYKGLRRDWSIKHTVASINIGKHNISGGLVGIIEKNSIWDVKRGISGIDICRTADLKFIGSSRSCDRQILLEFEPSIHTSMSSASGLSDTRMIITILVKPPMLTNHQSASIRSWLNGSE